MSHLLKSVEDGVMKIVLNRPEAMNALIARHDDGPHRRARTRRRARARSAASWCAAPATRRSAPAAT